jgi:hypothetical protein
VSRRSTRRGRRKSGSSGRWGTNPGDEPDETAEHGEAIPGFSDDEIADQIAPYLEEVDAEYADQLEDLADVFREKGPE